MSNKKKRKKKKRSSKNSTSNGRGKIEKFSYKSFFIYWSSTIAVSCMGVFLAGPFLMKVLIPGSKGQAAYPLLQIAMGFLFLLFGAIMFLYGVILIYRMVAGKFMLGKTSKRGR